MVANCQLRVTGLQIGRDAAKVAAHDGQLRGVIPRLRAEGEGADAFLDHERFDVVHSEGVAVGEEGAVEADLYNIDAGQLGGRQRACQVLADELGEAAGFVL